MNARHLASKLTPLPDACSFQIRFNQSIGNKYAQIHLDSRPDRLNSKKKQKIDREVSGDAYHYTS